MSKDKYLANYAEPEAQDIYQKLNSSSGTGSAFSRYQQVLVIPCFDEPADFLERILETFNDTNLLLIIVINQADDDYDDNSSNLALVESIKNLARHSTSICTSPKISIHKTNSAIDILCIDRFNQGARIAKNQGVGAARKIGCDIAYAFKQANHLESSWIYTSDADAQLPEGYFGVDRYQSADQQAINDNTAAIHFAYRHQFDDNSTDSSKQALEARQNAILLYEKKLHSYVEGLNYAGSYYAYPTVGSCLCLSAKHYGIVRGFPKLAAGEDFHILNKLRKVGDIVTLAKPVLQLSARLSTRVPFGTGRAVSSILAGNNDRGATINLGSDINSDTKINRENNIKDNTEHDTEDNITSASLFYHPRLYQLLKYTLEQFAALEITTQVPDFKTSFVANIRGHYSDSDSKIVLQSLETLGLDKMLKHLQSNISFEKAQKEQIAHQINVWFDALKTLKFIHLCRDNSGGIYGNLDWKTYQQSFNAMSTFQSSLSSFRPTV